MNGKQMIDYAIEAICSQGQVCGLSKNGTLVILTGWRAKAGTTVQFNTMTVDADGEVHEGLLSVDADKMYEIFHSLA